MSLGAWSVPPLSSFPHHFLFHTLIFLIRYFQHTSIFPWRWSRILRERGNMVIQKVIPTFCFLISLCCFHLLCSDRSFHIELWNLKVISFFLWCLFWMWYGCRPSLRHLGDKLCLRQALRYKRQTSFECINFRQKFAFDKNYLIPLQPLERCWGETFMISIKITSWFSSSCAMS